MTIIPPAANLTALRAELARRRADKGWTYDDLAKHSGVSRRTLVAIETGRTVGYLTTWHALAHAFGIPFGELASVLCEGHQPPQAPLAERPQDSP